MSTEPESDRFGVALSGPVELDLEVPGSKSMANRALVLAALASGTSILKNVPEGDDVAAMKRSLSQMGIKVLDLGGRIEVSGPLDMDSFDEALLDARLAGTTSRFLIALGALRAGRTVVSGEERLRERPFAELVDALRHLGATVDGGPGLPISVARGGLRGGLVSMSGEVSSQFISALMMVGPYLPGGLRIELSGEVVSASYIAMTSSLMERFGARVRVHNRIIEIEEGSYRPTEVEIEPDASSASYPAALAAIAGGTVRIRRAASIRLQSDRAIFDILRRMGCRVEEVGDDVVVYRDPSVPLEALDCDLRDSSDLVPTVAAVAATAKGVTHIRGVGFIRRKESDRIGDLARELGKFGVEVHEGQEGLDIIGGVQWGADIDPHHDHRLAMALALLGTIVEGTVVGDSRVVAKSWPGFFTDMGLDR